jgi:signal recognition particle GTPase
VKELLKQYAMMKKMMKTLRRKRLPMFGGQQGQKFQVG